MKRSRKCLIWIMALALTSYGGTYALLKDLHEPSVNDDGVPVFRSSFPRLTTFNRWEGNISLFFPKAGPANWFFLPVDSAWRLANDLPSATVSPEDDFWSEYFEYMIAQGKCERPKAKAEQ